MTRRDYELIATVLRTVKATDALAREFAYALREDNRGFKIDRFLAACKPEPQEVVRKKPGAMRPPHTGHAK